jgi:hypothetical protein
MQLQATMDQLANGFPGSYVVAKLLSVRDEFSLSARIVHAYNESHHIEYQLELHISVAMTSNT